MVGWKVCNCILPYHNPEACKNCPNSQDLTEIMEVTSMVTNKLTVWTPPKAYAGRVQDPKVVGKGGIRVKMEDGSDPRLTEEERNQWLQQWPQATD